MSRRFRNRGVEHHVRKSAFLATHTQTLPIVDFTVEVVVAVAIGLLAAANELQFSIHAVNLPSQAV